MFWDIYDNYMKILEGFWRRVERMVIKLFLVYLSIFRFDFLHIKKLKILRLNLYLGHAQLYTQVTIFRL